MGRAEQLLIRIKNGGAAEVLSMIQAEETEELFLDYKQSSTQLPARRLSDDDKKNLAKAIAGFANSEGGVIVWGVDCRTGPNGDVPKGPVPITDPKALKTLFDSIMGGLTLPAHSGVENIALIKDQASDGFVVTHVPAGLHVPYQTLTPRQEYFIRAGSSFVPTPHGVLAGLFGRAPQPNVIPVVRFQSMEPYTNVRRMALIGMPVSVVNRGRGIAESIYCMLDATLLPFRLNLAVSNIGQGDYVFTFSCGCHGGPGGAQTVILSGHAVDESVSHTRNEWSGLQDMRRKSREMRRTPASVLSRPMKGFVERFACSQLVGWISYASIAGLAMSLGPVAAKAASAAEVVGGSDRARTKKERDPAEASAAAESPLC
jgi:Putative DNA-binding domain